jgi:DNA invertase Pin-like site-specific DNA recombinase
MGEFERAIIQERVRAGMARAKSEGKRLGRPLQYLSVRMNLSRAT